MVPPARIARRASLPEGVVARRAGRVHNGEAMARYRRPLPEFSELQGPRGPHGLPLAGLGQRLGAHMLDGLAYLVAILPPLVVSSALDPASFLGVGMLLLLAVFVLQAWLLTTRGQSLGKIVVRIRIVDYRTGRHPGFSRIVLMRGVLPAIGNMFTQGLFSLIDVLFIFGRERRCVHDLMAGTSVVQADATVADPSRVFA